MLEQMRKQAQSAIVLLLFGFIIFVFVFSFGAGSVGFRSGGCGASNAAAIVNGEVIDLAEYRFVYQQELQQLMQQQKDGQSVSRQDKLALNQRVLDQLIDQRLVLQAARDLGLRVTDEERNQAMRDSQWFKNEAGEFDYKRYKNIVRWHFKTSMAQFEELYRQSMLYERMAGIIQDTARVTREELELAYRIRETKVDLEYVQISPNVYKMGLDPEPAEVQAFLEASRERVEEYYESHHDRYHQPKKVEVAHVFWPVEDDFAEDDVTDARERAELTVADLEEGAEFAKQAEQYSKDNKTADEGGKLDQMDTETMAARWGAPFAEAAMKLAEGEHSGVVRSDKGFHVIKALKVVPAVDRPLAEVEQDIARTLLIEQRAGEQARARAEQLLAGLKAGKSLAQQLAAAREAAEPAAEDAAGDSPPLPKPESLIRARKTGLVARQGGYIPQLGLDKDLARAAFSLTEDDPVADKVWEVDSPIGGKSFVVFRLIERRDADMEEFEATMDELRQQLLARRRPRQLANWLERKRNQAAIEVNEALRKNPNPIAVQRQQ